jgi:hypothetical protein
MMSIEDYGPAECSPFSLFDYRVASAYADKIRPLVPGRIVFRLDEALRNVRLAKTNQEEADALNGLQAVYNDTALAVAALKALL